MIFVTVGSSPHPFNRLIKKIDEIAGERGFKNDFLVQAGNSDYDPKNLKNTVKFMKEKEHENTIKKSELIITHSGLGNIMKCISNEKPLIIVPRRKKHGEHVDDHQMDLAKYFEERPGCIVLYKLNKLRNSIEELKGKKTVKRKENQEIFEIIRDFIESV